MEAVWSPPIELESRKPMHRSKTDARSEATVSPTVLPAVLPGVIAVIGCDGSGKSSITADLLKNLRRERRAEWRYMGLVSGESGDKIKRLPLIGTALERFLAAKARRAQDTRQKLPGTKTALIMYGFSVWRRRKLAKIKKLSAQGVVVIVDRYPQIEVPGFHYDGPGLTAAVTSSRYVQRLGKREQKLYEWMADHVPALVIRLNVDLATALERKPDHPSEELADKIAVMPKLRFNGARIVDIDTRAPYPEVLDAAWRAVEESLRPSGQEHELSGIEESLEGSPGEPPS